MDIINFYLDPTGNSVKELNFPESGNWGNQLGMTVSTEVFSSKGFHYLQIPSTFKTGAPFPDTMDPWTWNIGALCRRVHAHASREQRPAGSVPAADSHAPILCPMICKTIQKKQRRVLNIK